MWLGRPTKGTEAAPAAGAHATAKVAAKIAASKAALKAGEHGATTGALHGGDYARFKQPGETVDHEERRLWARVREKMKQRRVEQDTDAAMNHARESAQQQQQQKQQNDQQQHAPGEEGKAPARLLTQGGETSKVSAWLHTISSSKSPSKAPAGATARERDRAGTALPERQDASGQGRPPSSLSSRPDRVGTSSPHFNRRESRASPIPIGEDAQEQAILQKGFGTHQQEVQEQAMLQKAFETHQQEVRVLRETIELLRLQVESKHARDADEDRENGRQGRDTPSSPARATRASFGTTPDNKEQSATSNRTTHEPETSVLRETVKALKEERQAQDSELLECLAEVKSANMGVIREEQHDFQAGRRKDVVGQCCHTMQVLAASASRLLDENDGFKAELHSLQLSQRSDLLKVETELDGLRDSCRKQQKELEDLRQTNETLHKQVLQAAEKNLALERQVELLTAEKNNLEASQSGMWQVTKAMERQNSDHCATAKEMLEELERHRTANRELYAALVNARAASTTNGTGRLSLQPPHTLSPPRSSFLLDDKWDGRRSPPTLGPGVSPPRAARKASPPRIRGLTPPRLYEPSLQQRRAAAAGDLVSVEGRESSPPRGFLRPPKIEIALPSSASRERSTAKLEPWRVGHGVSTYLLQLPEPRDSVCFRVYAFIAV